MSPLDDFSPTTMEDEGASPGLGARLLGRLLSGLRYGRLRVTLPSGAVVDRAGAEPGPEAVIVVHRWRMLRRLVTGGDIGFAEGFIEGDWTTPDLTMLIRFAARNTEALAPAVEGSPLVRLLHRFGHYFNANTRRGSRRNIEAHYDLGNEFYRQWLDPSMLYSSAIWNEATDSLEAAQSLKLERIQDKLDLSGGEHILEIGCGWGALAAYLAAEADARVTGITLSPSQLTWAKAVTERSGKADRIDLRLQDYRDIQGSYDRIVSIEMFEAVGEAYWPDYFDTLKRCLKPGGRAVLQIISIEPKRYDNYRRDTDFIQKYIFPGGFLPSDPALEKAVARAGLVLGEVEHFGKSYARTLAEWRSRFKAGWPSIAPLGFDQRFYRLWDYYLSYCEAGFEERTIDVGLYVITHAQPGDVE